MPRNKETTTSEFYCTKCGKKGIPIARKLGSQREAGHLKRLYCPFCREDVNHAEVRPFGDYDYEDFRMEFELGRFLEDGTKVAIMNLQSCSNTECQYNVNGKCWNSNNSYYCIFKN